MLFVAIWMLSTKDFGVLRALGQHEPSARIFRSLLELNLIMFGSAFSLYVWSRTIGTNHVARLFFEAEDYESEVESSALLEDSPGDEDVGKSFGLELETTESEGNEDGIHRLSSLLVPKASTVLSAALDAQLVIFVALFLFCWSQSIEESSAFVSVSRIAAPTFPLLLFVYMVLFTTVPSKRRRFWEVVGITLGAPLYKITFRDGFVGDVLTSSVRPMQDMVFTIAYILYGLQGWWSQGYKHEDEPDEEASSVLPTLEKSWVLHTLLLPLCVVGPLWWRYLQNLRQVAEYRQRWPYMGNAFKYFVAAQVAVYGVFYPEWHDSPMYIACFVGATLYQIWWDVVMDWGLLARSKNESCGFRRFRLYKRPFVYSAIAIINAVLRFCWTLSFLPTRYLHPGGLLVREKGILVTPTIASAEIVRRTLWGLLRFEYEVAKDSLDGNRDNNGKIEMIDLRSEGKQMDSFVGESQDSAFRNDAHMFGELAIYAVAFLCPCLAAAAHRTTE